MNIKYSDYGVAVTARKIMEWWLSEACQSPPRGNYQKLIPLGHYLTSSVPDLLKLGEVSEELPHRMRWGREDCPEGIGKGRMVQGELGVGEACGREPRPRLCCQGPALLCNTRCLCSSTERMRHCAPSPECLCLRTFLPSRRH